MQPFSKILGLDNTEFDPWKNLLVSGKKCVVLVEGEIDKAYIEHIHKFNFQNLVLPEGLEIVPYDGKEALKNSIILKFVIQTLKKVLVTFDLDAKPELARIMGQIGLQEGIDYIVIGVDKPGKQCIEGLLPERVLSNVYSHNTDLVMQLMSADAKDKKSAKSALKQKLLNEFKSDTSVSPEDLRSFLPMFKAFGRLVARDNA